MRSKNTAFDSLFNQAKLAFEEERYSQALAYCHQIIEQNSNHLPTLELSGTIQGMQGAHHAAGQLFEACIALAPNNPVYYYNFALSQIKINSISEAIRILQESLACHLQNSPLPPKEASEIFFRIGQQLHHYEQYEAAIQAYEKSLSVHPKNTAVLLALGASWHAMRQPKKAIPLYRQLLQISPLPEAHGNLAQSLLMAGEWEAGFAEYEWRTCIPDFAPIFSWFQRKPRWKGECFAGKTLLIHDEQGFGDAFQLVRYASLVKARGGTVILSAKKSAISILTTAPGIDEVVEHTEKALSNIHFDLSIPLMSLPYLFGTTLRTVPCAIPYLFPKSNLCQKWDEHFQRIRNFKVGLVWAGNPNHTHGLNRTCEAKNLLPLLNTPGIRFFSLQVGSSSSELNHLPAKIRPYDFSSKIDTFMDTAGIIQHLDAVISVDTAVAHLAGGMGKKVFLLLPFASEWRWLAQGNTTPWYPSFQLFRQSTPQDWDTPIKQVQNALLQFKNTY